MTDAEIFRSTLERIGMSSAQFADIWGVHELTAHRYVSNPAASRHAISPPVWAMRAAWLMEASPAVLRTMALQFKMRPAAKPRGRPVPSPGSEAPARKRGRPRKVSTV